MGPACDQRLQQVPERDLGEAWFDVQRGHPQQFLAGVADLLEGALVDKGKAQRFRIEDEYAIAGRIQEPQVAVGLGFRPAQFPRRAAKRLIDLGDLIVAGQRRQDCLSCREPAAVLDQDVQPFPDPVVETHQEAQAAQQGTDDPAADQPPGQPLVPAHRLALRIFPAFFLLLWCFLKWCTSVHIKHHGSFTGYVAHVPPHGWRKAATAARAAEALGLKALRAPSRSFPGLKAWATKQIVCGTLNRRTCETLP
jgi:hypothetical protein